MGLLAYKAHCSTIEPEYSFACATEEEMKEFITNLDIHLVIEEHKGMKNLVVTFTPFPVKYLNYIKRYNAKPHPGMANIKVIKNAQRSIFIQLFRKVNKNGCDSSYYSYWTAYWGGRNKEYGGLDYANAHLKRGEISPCCTYGHSTPIGNPATQPMGYAHFKTSFKYLLTPYDAQRGFMVVLHNVNFEAKEGCGKFICKYGVHNGTTNGSYNFHYGLTAGITMGEGINIAPVKEMITYHKLNL